MVSIRLYRFSNDFIWIVCSMLLNMPWPCIDIHQFIHLRRKVVFVAYDAWNASTVWHFMGSETNADREIRNESMHVKENNSNCLSDSHAMKFINEASWHNSFVCYVSVSKIIILVRDIILDCEFQLIVQRALFFRCIQSWYSEK